MTPAALMTAAGTLGRRARPAPPPGPYLVAGLGRAGRAAALAARAAGTDVVAWDAADLPPQRQTARSLRRAGVDAVLGGDGTDLLRRLRQVGTIVKSPGIAFDITLLREADRLGLGIIDELELGWRLARGPVIAVTGTNGKSTTCALISCALGGAIVAGNTHFGPPLCEVPLSDAPVVCEVSSFQLEGATDFLPEIAVFTNLTVEHLDRHGSMERYFQAKRRMFVRAGRTAGLGIVNVDDRFGARLADEIAAAGGRVVRCGAAAGADIRLVGRSASAIDVEAHGERATIPVPLPGGHNAANALAAVAVSHELGRGWPDLAPAATPPGRWERIDEGQAFAVVVDYAHTPDGIARALAAAREGELGPDGRVHVVFGPLGLSEPCKARGSGEALATGADEVVLTTGSAPDAPRVLRIRELRDALRADGHGRPAGVTVVLDRARAIDHALAAARPGDAVLILGLGEHRVQALDMRGTLARHSDQDAARHWLQAHAAEAPCGS